MTVHRGMYTLELGFWHATCRACEWTVIDKDRRRAAAQFRQHIRATTDEGQQNVDDSRPKSASDVAGLDPATQPLPAKCSR
jgi:hypothetical protein